MKTFAGGGVLRSAALLLAVLTIIPLTLMPSRDATAASSGPTSVEVTNAGTKWDGNIFLVTVSHANGTTSSFNVDVWWDSGAKNWAYDYLGPNSNDWVDYGSNAGGMTEMTSMEPGVMVGAFNPMRTGATYSSRFSLFGTGFAAKTACTTGNTPVCLTVALKTAPATQSVTVNQTPVTGAPASDLMLPAVVVACGIGFAGIMLRRRRA